MQSATSKTSFMLWLIRTTPRPWSASRRTRFEHLLGLGDAERGGRLVEDDELGSSTAPPGDRHGLALATGEAGDLLAHRLQRAHGQAGERLARRAAPSSASSSTTAGVLLAAEEHVLDDVEVVAQREVLVDDLDAEGVGVLGGRARAPAGPRSGTRRRRTGGCPAMPLISVRLAGAVVADERGDLARRRRRGRRRAARGRRRSSC